MTVKELKEKIKDLPDHMDVAIYKDEDYYEYSHVETAEVREVLHYDKDDPENKETKAYIKCLVISDEN